jgi:parvulin-like peptidyl-prolyl isomerase
MGTVTHGSLMPAMEEVTCSLKVGALSDPLKTQFGYHLIKLEARDGKTFKDARAEIEPKVTAELAKKAVEDLIAKVKVVKNPEYYSDPPPTVVGEPKKQ